MTDHQDHNTLTNTPGEQQVKPVNAVWDGTPPTVEKGPYQVFDPLDLSAPDPKLFQPLGAAEPLTSPAQIPPLPDTRPVDPAISPADVAEPGAELDLVIDRLSSLQMITSNAEQYISSLRAPQPTPPTQEQIPAQAPTTPGLTAHVTRPAAQTPTPAAPPASPSPVSPPSLTAKSTGQQPEESAAEQADRTQTPPPETDPQAQPANRSVGTTSPLESTEAAEADTTPAPTTAPENQGTATSGDQSPLNEDDKPAAEPEKSRAHYLQALRKASNGRLGEEVSSASIPELKKLLRSLEQVKDAERKTTVHYKVFGDDGPVDIALQFGAGALEALGQGIEGFGDWVGSAQAVGGKLLREQLTKAVGAEAAGKLIQMQQALMAASLTDSIIKAAGLTPAEEKQLRTAMDNPLAFVRFLGSGDKDLDAFLANRTEEEKLRDAIAAQAIASLKKLSPFGIAGSIPSAKDLQNIGKQINTLAQQVGVPQSLAARAARATGVLAATLGVTIMTMGAGGVLIGAGQGFYVQKQELLKLGIDPNTKEGFIALTRAGFVAGALEGVQLGALLRFAPGGKNKVLGYLLKTLDDAGTGAFTEAVNELNQKAAAWQAAGRELDEAAVKELTADLPDKAIEGGVAGALVGRLLDSGRGAGGAIRRAAKGRLGNRPPAPVDLTTLPPEHLVLISRYSGIPLSRIGALHNMPVPPRAAELAIKNLGKDALSHDKAMNQGFHDKETLRWYPKYNREFTDADKAKITAEEQASFETERMADARDVAATDREILSLQNRIDHLTGQKKYSAALHNAKKQYRLILRRDHQAKVQKRTDALTDNIRQLQKTDPDVAAALMNRLDQMRRHQPDMTVRDWRDQMTRLETLARDGTARGRALALLQGRSAAEQDFVARTRSGTDRVAGGAAGHAQTIAQAHLARAGYSRPPDGGALQNSIKWLEQNHPDLATRHAQAIDTAQGPEVNPADTAGINQVLDDARDLHTLETDLIRAETEGADGGGRDNGDPNPEDRKSKSLLEDDGNTDGDDNKGSPDEESDDGNKNAKPEKPVENDNGPDPVNEPSIPEDAEIIKDKGNRRRPEDIPDALNPTDAQKKTAKKMGVDPKWIKPDGKPDWPDDHGFDGDTWKVTLKEGTLIDRFGGEIDGFGRIKDWGSYSSPKGLNFGQRALPANKKNDLYVAYKVVKPIDNVRMGRIMPWFDQPGGGIQHHLPMSINELRRGGYIEVIEVEHGKN